MTSLQSIVSGLRIAVVVNGSRLSDAVASDLVEGGARVARVIAADERAGGVRAITAAAAELGGLDALVDAASLPEDWPLSHLADLDEADWIERSEGPVRRQLWLLQAAYPHLKESRGRIVVVQPNLGISGMSGAAAIGATVEGQRIMAKVAARAWGPEVAANVLAVSPELVLPGIDLSLVAKMAEVATGFRPPALRPVGSSDVSRDISPLVAFLASPAGGLITGQTLIADGGSWMTP